ncbi:MAG: hypothetical protein QHH17_06970 [Candidatus Bathyarchaeota archaeon]|nr:hypothetical protein [Candidatus Bathyarchaeota archaeon]
MANPHAAISVIEEKGEGFEKRKNPILGCWWFSLQPQPSILHRKT